MHNLRLIIDVCLLPIIIAAVAVLLLYTIYRNTIKTAVAKKYEQSNSNKPTVLTVIVTILLTLIFAITAVGLSIYNLHHIKEDVSYITNSKESSSKKDEVRYFDIFGNEYEYDFDVILYDENSTAYHQNSDNLTGRYIGDNGKMFYTINAYLNKGGCLVCFNTDFEENVEYTDNSYEIITADGEHLYWTLGCYWDIDGNLIINPDGEDKKIVITKEEQEQYQLEHGIFLKIPESD